MGNNTNPCYVYLKGKTYYFTRHVPKDVRGYYTSNRVVMCLKTQSRSLAVRAAKNISSKLDDAQAGYDGANATFITAAGGSDLILHSAGWE